MRDRQLHPKAACKIHKRGKPHGTKPHGTRYSYVLGCRCPACLAANRKYGREYRAAKRNGRAPHPGNSRMRWPVRELEQRKSLTVDSVVIVQRGVGLYAL